MAKRCCSLDLCAVTAAAQISDPLCARSESKEEGIQKGVGAQGLKPHPIEKGVAAAGVAAGTPIGPSTRSTVSVCVRWSVCVGGRGGEFRSETLVDLSSAIETHMPINECVRQASMDQEA